MELGLDHFESVSSWGVKKKGIELVLMLMSDWANYSLVAVLSQRGDLKSTAVSFHYNESTDYVENSSPLKIGSV